MKTRCVESLTATAQTFARHLSPEDKQRPTDDDER